MADSIYKYEISPEILSWDGEPPFAWNAIGKAGLKYVDADAKIKGTALYTRDLIISNMLYAKPLVSPYAHAEIKSIDISKAEALDGVIKVVKWDSPELTALLKNEWMGMFEKVEYLSNHATYEGNPCGAIVIAESEDIADEALRLLEVEWEEHPFVLDIDSSLESGAPIARPHQNPDNNILETWTEELGDVEQGFAEADHVAEFTTNRTYITWAGVEAGSCVARLIGEHLELWVHVQSPSDAVDAISTIFEYPKNKINIHFPYNGGTYGGGGSPGQACMPLAVIGTLLTQRPVKFMLDGAVSHFYGGSMDFSVGDIKVGFKDDGKITALYSNVRVANAEYPPGHGGGPGHVYHIIDSSAIPNVKEDSTQVFVNRARTTAMRCEALGTANTYSMVMNRVAAELGMDPTEVALKNDGNCGDDSAWLAEYRQRHGFPDRDSLTECMETGKAAADWDNNWHAPGTKKLPNGKMHGIGCNWEHGWHHELSCSDCNIELLGDGSARIFGQHSDIGVSAETAYCQMVADEVGLKYEDVTHWHMDDCFAKLTPPGGAWSFTSNTPALRKASRQLKSKILQLATATGEYEYDYTDKPGGHRLAKWAKFPELTPEDLDIVDGEIFEKANPDNKVPVSDVAALTLHGWLDFGPPPGGYPQELIDNNPLLGIVYNGCPAVPPLFGYGWHNRMNSVVYFHPMPRSLLPLTRQVSICEVEVDTETGEIEVTNVTRAYDAGKVFSPEGCESQEYGGTYMGIGRAEMEEVVYDQSTGVKLNDNLLDYKFTTMNDIDNISVNMVETSLGWGPYGTVGIAESAATVTPAVLAPAVYNAIGKWIYDLPITPDKVLKALGKA